VSRGEDFARFTSGIGAALEVEIGAVDDEPCAVGPCDSDAVYRVPWPSVGGDVAYCEFHLARYRARHPELWDRVQDAADEDLTAYATRGDRFLTFDEVPETLFDEKFVAIALLTNGHALYEEDDPDETVVYLTVDRRLEIDSRKQIARSVAGELLSWVEETHGVHEWADDALAALYGEVSA